MQTLPLVSIALCTYNGAAHLKEQLLSILNQRYKNIEVVVVDDASTDDSWSIAKSLLTDPALKGPQVRLYQNERNLGYSKNFERAISLCNGEFIALSDQDDIWNVEKVEKMVAAIGSHSLIYHDSAYIDEAGNSLHKYTSDRFHMYQGHGARALLLENCVSGHTCMFHEKIRNYILPIPAGVFHDWWIAYQSATFGSIVYLPEPLVKYRRHAENVTFTGEKFGRKAQRVLKLSQKRERAINEAIRLKACADFGKNPDRDFVRKLHDVLKGRIDHWLNFRAFILLSLHRQELFSVSKKAAKRPLSFVFDRYFLGLKLKAYWYRLIS
ncbi:glycosyltransferase family 2 protein [Parapedobacter sp. 10938]|uniref:glycosyltransferase family 2 protein n=1 Tax=Parapedobacter flavus TaxID=3110225 RepID=UPI002DB76B16|nr:glycosyltransferase family 2 protein [Parapedobacter sp. 10938]MEC3878249.1 glycosyltransferase family 2 protein [Parapedobacter sp. 10938]